MSASGTLRRHLTKQLVTLPDGQQVWADIDRPLAPRKGTPFRRVTTVRHPTAAWPYEVTFHATKGARCVRVSA